MKTYLEHIKKWALQDQGGLSARQVADAVARMCDDAIAEIDAAEPVTPADACPSCAAVDDNVHVWEAGDVTCNACGKPR